MKHYNLFIFKETNGNYLCVWFSKLLSQYLRKLIKELFVKLALGVVPHDGIRAAHDHGREAGAARDGGREARMACRWWGRAASMRNR
jgi:hypothetical protein